MSALTITNLHVHVDDKKILQGVNLTVAQGTVHILMGPNGSGKSTLANALMGNPKYTVSEGTMHLDGQDITTMAVHERAKLGLFLSFQYPKEITGVTMNNFLRIAWNSLHEEKMNVLDFHRKLKAQMTELGIDPQFSKRYVNEGFSGGEKKRAEILQMAILSPKYAILDETDSGLDVNSLKTVGECIEKMKSPDRGMLIITHYNRILKYITPDHVSILMDGKIVKTGGKDLVDEIDTGGFKEIQEPQVMSNV